MFSISINYGPAGTVWNLLFKEEEKAAILYDTYVELREKGSVKGIWKARDDYGQRMVIEVGDVHAMVLENLNESQLGQVERGLHNARTQARAQQRAMSDATLKTAAMAQGPAVLSGGMPNGRFNG